MVINEAPDVLEDDDVLEMVNAGLAPITVVDDYLAEFWSQVFTDIKVHPDVTVRSGGNLAVAFRKENPTASRGREHVAQEARQRRRDSATWSNGAISRTSSTRRTRRPTPNARS